MRRLVAKPTTQCKRRLPNPEARHLGGADGFAVCALRSRLLSFVRRLLPLALLTPKDFASSRNGHDPELETSEGVLRLRLAAGLGQLIDRVSSPSGG